jgi:hypothetical protein
MYTRLEKEGKDKERDRSDSCPLEGVVRRKMKALQKEKEESR